MGTGAFERLERRFVTSGWIPLALLVVVAASSCALFWWSHSLWMDSFREHVPAGDNVRQARISITKGYLYVQLHCAGDRTIGPADAMALVDQGIMSIGDCLDGRSTLADFVGIPIRDAAVTKPLVAMRDAARNFRNAVADLVANRAASKTDESLALRPRFSAVVNAANDAELALNEHLQKRLEWQHRFHLVAVVLWVGFMLGLIVLWYYFDQARTEAEALVRRSQEHLSVTLQSIGDAVIATDADGKVTSMNPVAEALSGWPIKDALGQPLEEVFRIVNADSRQTVENPATRVLREGCVVGLANHTMLLGRDGEEHHIADSAAPIRFADGTVAGVILVFRDVTDDLRREEQMRQVQKMEAMGQLAGGVAHDFNNALAAILGGAQLLRNHVPDDPTTVRYATMIEQSAERAAHLTQQLLSFSRKGRVQTVDVDVNALIRNVCGMLEHLIDKRITISLSLAREAPHIMGDPSQLENALLNLAVNARDAMPAGGTLEFASNIIEVDEMFVLRHPNSLSKGTCVEVVVSDSGIGMTREVQEHLFEPFFTTKGVGKGTGLGLSAVYGAVKEHNGSINVYSEPGRGTTFRLYFPVTDTSPRNAHERPAPVHGNGRILVIEDEPVLRIMAADMLGALGYTVDTAEDGAGGVLACRAAEKPFDLVILDLMMPRMSGTDTFIELRKIDQKMKIVVASGFGLQGAPQQMLDMGAVGYLRKPYTMEEIASVIAGALARNG